jgi:hypothetical protein
VPARKADGSCKFLNHRGLCDVHAAAPYGCAMFSAHQAASEADARAKAGLFAILRDRQASGEYARLWNHLKVRGLVAPTPEENRAKMTAYLKDKEQSHG